MALPSAVQVTGSLAPARLVRRIRTVPSCTAR